ncbi:GNAT family N-acetyltransferase [Nocardiopsis synnemataformans]|uniref:GNAT family N-acetyltransferase n=1 Tax=Nocardiopsis synnemataformans TaxID=61305 RepID=UPI003EB91B7C
MPVGCCIREATERDAKPVYSFVRSNDALFEVDIYMRGLLPGETCVLVAENSEGAIVGWLEGLVDGAYRGAGADPIFPEPHGYVQAMMVSPAMRRRGVGSALLEAFAQRARSQGCEWMFLLPDETDDPTERVRFFESVGLTAVNDPSERFPAMAAPLIRILGGH